MMLPAGVVQSIDANTVNLDQAWIYADQDIWSQDYSEVLLQPISIEAVDINDLRFQAAEVVISIRANPDPMSQVLWSGWCETVADPSGSTPDLETRISCGVIDPVPPVFVDNGNGTASIFGFRCAIRPVPDYTQSPSDFEIAPATLSFVSNTESYVCVRYNSGAPVMYVESNQANINGSDVVLIFVVWRTGNELHSVSTDSRGIGLADKIAGMITRTQPYSLVHGQQLTLGVVTTPAVRTVTIAAATIYAGVDAIPLTALNSSNPAQRFTRVAPTAGVYGFLNQTQLDCTNYSNGTNVVAMAANRYSPRWVYRTVGDDAQAFYVLGNEYTNIASAQAAPLPTGLPLVVQDHAVLVGRVIVQNGIDAPVQIDQVVDVNFATSTANMHNNLDGLQGTGPDYYHMDVTRWTNTGNGPWLPLTAGSSNTLTGTLYGTAGAEFGSGALVLVTQGSGSTLAQTYMRGGDLSLAGNSGRANLRIMGSISADTAGVGPGLSFAGVSTGVGATGGGMLLQLATNNGLDVYSWNNTAWIKKSQINSAGMIAVVGGTAAGFLKANGTIDTTGYLTSINPTYTGRLTGPEQYLENDGQILLAIRRPGGNSGRIHGIAFQAQTLNGTWADFGRVMTYISSVADGAQTGGMRLYAYNAGTIVQALDAGPTGVTFAGLLSGPRATLTEFGTMAAMPGDSNYATLHATGVTRTASNYALRLADSGADTLVNAATNVALAIAGAAKLGVTSSNVNLASGVSLSFSATTVIDSSRNAAFVGLTTTGNPTFGSTTGSSSIHINSGAGTASSLNFMDDGVTRATLQLYTSNVFRLVARNTAGTEIDSPIYIDLTAGGEITIGGTSRVTNFKNALEMNGVVFVDSSRNATLNNISGGNIVLNTTAQEVAILRRPGATTNLLWGLDFQGQTADLTWVNYNRLQSRIVSATNGAWSGALRVINYNAGTAQITAEFAPTLVNFASGVELQMAGSRLVDTNKNITMGPTLTLNTGTGTQANVIFRNTADYWTSMYVSSTEFGFRDYNNDGSPNSYPLYWTLKAGGLLRITRPTNFLGALQMSGTQFLDTSRNASFAGLTATSLTLAGNINVGSSGTSLRGIYGNMGDNDSWRVMGGATGSNAGYLEIATDDDGTEPIYVRQYTGTFASPSAVRSMTLLDANGNTSIPGNLSANGAWIEAVGSNTQGRFKSQYSGAAASYIGNWPANNWWGIGSDGSTAGTKGVLRVGQCASDGAFVTDGVRFAALGDLQASHYVYANNADFGSVTTPNTTLVVRYGSPNTSPTAPGGLYLSCDGGINPRIEFCDSSRNWTIDSYDTNLRFYVNGNIKGQLTENSGFAIKGAVDGSAPPAGYVGQVIESRVATASAPSANTITTITSILLTPGSWEVSGHVTAAIADGSNLWTTFYGWCSTSTASMPNKGTAIANTVARANTSTDSWATSTITPIRIDVTTTTACYLLMQFGTGPATAMTAAGAIRALRIR